MIHLWEVLSEFRKAGLTSNPKKCHLELTEAWIKVLPVGKTLYVITDHAPLQWMAKSKDWNSWVTRCFFHYKISSVKKSGSVMQKASPNIMPSGIKTSLSLALSWGCVYEWLLTCGSFLHRTSSTVLILQILAPQSHPRSDFWLVSPATNAPPAAWIPDDAWPHVLTSPCR